jgi:hypothetical protein
MQHGGLTSFGGVTIGATTDLTNNRDLVFKDAISAVTMTPTRQALSHSPSIGDF